MSIARSNTQCPGRPAFQPAIPTPSHRAPPLPLPSHPLSLTLASLLLALSPAQAQSPASEDFDFFETHIRPALVERCYECHSSASGKSKGGLLLDTREALRQGGSSGRPGIVPGHPEQSLLLTALRYQDDTLQMPPKGKLPQPLIDAFDTWIRLGAPDPRTADSATVPPPPADPRSHWAFQPPRAASPPPVRQTSWVQTPVDAFILATLESLELRPAPQADRRTLIRRATFDLHGLPPTPAEVESFVHDPGPDAYDRLLTRLLESPRYGERWGRHWLDVARYADTKGYVYDDREDRRYVHAYPYRDWVIRAFNDDLPYDRFLQLQLAADQMDGPPADLAAMGFLTLGRRFLGVSHEIIDDRIDVLTRGMQGLTAACARCHDHKFDPIPTRDYYSLYGVFDSSTETLVPLTPQPDPTPARQEFERGLAERQKKFDDACQTAREEVARRIRQRTPDYLLAQLTAHLLPSEDFYEILDADALNPLFVRRWQAYLRETAKTFHPIFAPWHTFAALPAADFGARSPAAWADLRASSADRLNPIVLAHFDGDPPRSMEEVARRYGDLFSTALQEPAAPEPTPALDEARAALRRILFASDSPVYPPNGSLADTHFYFEESARVNLGRLFKDIETWHLTAVEAPPYAGILQDLPQPRTPRVFRRGNPANRAEEVPRQFLEIVAGPQRQPFAHGSGRLELAQAIARRDNPLTARVLVNRVWMHHFGNGLVKTASDFGTRCEPPSHPALLDYLAVWFMDHGWSLKNLHRLIMTSAVYQQSSEPIAPLDDASASADPENRLLRYFPRRRLDFEALRDALLAVSGNLDLTLGGRPSDLFRAPFSHRRSVYGLIDRLAIPGPLRAFDVANPDLHIPQRHQTTVPQQALFLLNHPFVAERARALADRAAEAAPPSRVRHLYAAAFQRPPTPAEARLALTFIDQLQAQPLPPPPPPPPSPWSYGYGELDLANRSLKSFTPFPHFTQEAWQGGPAWPDPTLGWLRLTAQGGHPGEGLARVVVRRWTAPHPGLVHVEGTAEHTAQPGDGIRATIVHSQLGILTNWPAILNSKTETRLDAVPVKAGEWLDFVVDSQDSLSHDDFLWAPRIRSAPGEAAPASAAAPNRWDAQRDFGGPPPSFHPLDPWAALAQVLLLSNEFAYVD